MNIKPLYDHVIIERIEEEKTSQGGIVIPDTATEKPNRGKIIAVGTGRLDKDGQVQPLVVKVGDEVLFRKYSGTDVKVGSHDYIVVKEEDIIGIVQA